MKILIDKSTIKKNENAGSTRSRVIRYGTSEQTISLMGTLLQDDLPIIEKFLRDEIGGRLVITAYTQVRNDEFMNHLPIPEYDYEHENPMIHCDECNGTFSFQHLVLNLGEVNYCPICDGDIDEEIEYESIEEANARK